MKKRLTLLALLLSAGAMAYAQTGILDIHPAGDPAGKILTMEEAIYRGVGSARSAGARWDGDDAFRFTRNGQFLRQEIKKGKLTPAQPQDPAQALTAPAPQRPVVGNATSAFSRDGSLYIRQGGRDVAIAVSEGPGIVYGESVSRNEMGIGEGYYWSPTRNKLAFYRKDESRVTLFPLLDITTRTGTLREIRYPMNGMASEHITLGVYDLVRAQTVYMQVTDFDEERYLTNITWSPDERYIYIQVVDRAQHHMHLNQYDAATGAFIRTLLTEENEQWIEPLDHLYFIEGRNDLFLYRTDNRDGYRNLYLADTLGTIRRLTAVDADVEYVANNGKSVYYTSAEVSPVENHLFRIDLTLQKKDAVRKARFSKPVNLTPERGWHSISLNSSMTWFLDTYSNLNVPSASLIRSTDGKVSEVLAETSDPLAGYASCEVDLGTVKSADGQFDNYYRLIKPLNFDPAKKYPVIVYVYGGPHTQLVRDTWLGSIRMWEMLMAQKGYLVYVQDNRGTPNRGAAFEKAINRRCGVAEMEDQMEGIKMLKSLPYVDADRIGVHGWSYGGFMTISLMTTYPDTFKVGVAGGPVIDWKWYEVMYGERYMDNPETNPEGFAQTSLIGKAKNLKGKLLICQGAIDDTVVWQHSLSFVQQCIDDEVQLDYFPYPTDPHNVRGYRRIHLMDKVTQYFEDYL